MSELSQPDDQYCSKSPASNTPVNQPHNSNSPAIPPDAASENHLYQLLPTDGIRQLTSAFYRRVPLDDILGPMYPPHDLPGAEERLRLFLTFRFGGPQDYLQKRGHPALRARHAPFHINQAARDRWMLLMNEAIDECHFQEPAPTILRRFLSQVATFLINRQ
jgi:hemoglobin